MTLNIPRPYSNESTFNKVQINLTALRHNFRQVKAIAEDQRIMAMVKCDAYGHGLVEAALALVQAGADSLGVADALEGATLRKAGVKVPICVISGLCGSEQVDLAFSRNLQVFCCSKEQIDEVAAQAVKLDKIIDLNVKIDTGMGRLGLCYDEAVNVIKQFAGNPHLRIQGLVTHLATVGDQCAYAQLARFDSVCRQVDTLGGTRGVHSALASAGLLAHPEYRAAEVRPGIMLFGIHPAPGLGLHVLNLRPVMTVTSRVLQVKKLNKGDAIGYDLAFVAPRDTLTAAVPFGFAHGLSRSRSNIGYVLIKGRRAPLLGRVSMGLSVYDVSGIEDVAAGDEVVILGRQGGEEVTVAQLSDWGRSIPYEVLCHLGRLNTKFFEGFDYESND